MKKTGKLFFILLGAGLSFGAAAESWNTPTPAPLPTQVQPRLNVQIGRETEEITFVNTNNDPFVYTKVYILKHADPYEIRPYIMSAIRSRRVDTNLTKVEAVKYADGTGMLIVSAEEYRFKPVENGMSIDAIVTELDKPDLKSEEGRKYFLYYPKYFDSISLAKLIRRVGMIRSGDSVELDGGIDAVRADTGLNALLFYSTPASVRNIGSVLEQYDAPATEALVEYRIYELGTENDGNLGVDFQAWKNGPGADLFAAGARYMSGWDRLANNVASNLIRESHSSFINFNPKWNSKYLDFLVARSKAKVVTGGRLSIMNRATGMVSNVTRMPVIVEGTETAGNGNVLNESIVVSEWGPAYTLSAVDQKKGMAISIDPASYDGEVVLTRTQINTRTYYTLSLNDSGAAFVRADGRNLGRVAQAYDAAISYTDDTVSPAVTTTLDDWSRAYAYVPKKDKTRVTKQAEFGFTLSLTPEINGRQSIVKVSMSNTNLIGFKSNGEPRTSMAALDTNIQVANDGGTFYIGGLEKSELVRSVSKVPFLGDIPVLGWLFSAENETVKKSQLVAVLTVIPVDPKTPVPADFAEEAGKIGGRISNFGLRGFDENEYGFDQYLLDREK